MCENIAKKVIFVEIARLKGFHFTFCTTLHKVFVGFDGNYHIAITFIWKNQEKNESRGLENPAKCVKVSLFRQF